MVILHKNFSLSSGGDTVINNLAVLDDGTATPHPSYIPQNVNANDSQRRI